MKKIRLRDGVGYPKKNTIYGLVTHEWSLVPDNAYVYKDMEVFGEQKPIVVAEQGFGLGVTDAKVVKVAEVTEITPPVEDTAVPEVRSASLETPLKTVPKVVKVVKKKKR